MTSDYPHKKARSTIEASGITAAYRVLLDLAARAREREAREQQAGAVEQAPKKIPNGAPSE